MIPNKCYTEEFEITSHDVDINNNIKPTNMLQYLQETGNHHMRDRKPTYYDLLEDGKSFVVSRFAIEYLEPIRMYDKLKVSTWRNKEKGVTFYRSFQAEVDGKLVVKAFSEWAVVNIKEGGLWKSAEVNLQNYEMGEPINLSIPIKFRFPKDIDWELVSEEKIMYTSVDCNLHLNNTYYQNLMWNQIPNVEKKVMVASSIRFMKEAKLNSKVKVYIKNQKDVEKRILDNEKEEVETYYFLTMIGEEKNAEGIIVCKNIENEFSYIPYKSNI